MTHVITNLIVSFASIFLDPGLTPQPVAGKLIPAAVKCPATVNEQLAQLPTCPAAQYGADFDCGYGWVCYPEMYGYEACGDDTATEVATDSISPFQVVEEEPSYAVCDDNSPFRMVLIEEDLSDEIAMADLIILGDSLSDAGREILNAAAIACNRLLDMIVSAISDEPATESQALAAIAELKEMSVALLSRSEAETASQMRMMNRIARNVPAVQDARQGERILRGVCRNVPAGKRVPRLAIKHATCRNVPAGQLVPRLAITRATCRSVPALAFRAVEPRIIGEGESPFVVIHKPRSARVASVPAIPAGEFEPTLRISRRILNRAVAPAIPSGEYRSCVDVARMGRTVRSVMVARTQLHMPATSSEASPFVAVQEVIVHVAASSASPFSPFIEVISDRQVAIDAELSDEAVEEVSDAADAIPTDTDSAFVSNDAVYVASRIQSLSKAILTAVSQTLGQARAAAEQE